MNKIAVLATDAQIKSMARFFKRNNIALEVFNKEEKFLAAIAAEQFAGISFFAEDESVRERDIKYFGNLNLLMKLRAIQQCNLPIFILSKFSKETLIKHTNGNPYWKKAFEAVKSPEVYLIHEVSKKKFQPLLDCIAQSENIDKLTLKDVQYSFFDPKGVVHEIMHDLKNELYTTHINCTKKEIKARLFSLIETAFTKAEIYLPNQNKSRFNNFLRLYCDDIGKDIDEVLMENTKQKKFIYDRGKRIGLRYMDEVYLLIPDAEKNIEATSKVNRWECVAIDDTDEVRERLKEFFAKKNIVCHLFRDYQSAKETILNNKKVTTVISDLRITEPDGSWNKYQGYKILEEVRSNCGRPLAYFVLTGKRGTVSNLIQESFDFKVHWFIKDDVLSSEGAFNLFFYEHLAKECDKIQFRLLQQPRLSNVVWWKGNSNRYTLPLSQYYKAHIESYDYNESETRINEFTKRFVSEVKKGAASVVPEITCTIKEKNISENGLKKFRDNILTGRRIAYALASDDFTPEEILNKFQNKSSNPKAVFNTSLATASNPANDLEFVNAIYKGDKAECNLLIEEINFIGPELKEKLQLNEDDYLLIEDMLYQFYRLYLKEKSPKQLTEVVKKFEDFKTPKLIEIQNALSICRSLLSETQIENALKLCSDCLQSPPIKSMIDKFLYSN